MPASANDSRTKNFLLITYYWPPSGGVGVQRWLQLSKYLPGAGWKPVVLTPENPAFGLQDPSLLQAVPPDLEVIRLPITEPYHLLNRITGKKSDDLAKNVLMDKEAPSLGAKALRWLRGNLLIPDPRVFWVRAASRFALDVLEKNDIQAIITTGPPHSMHLIGQAIKKKTGLPWLADFRDPWSQWEILHRMHPSALALQLHRRLERQVVQQADLVLTASEAIGQSLPAAGTPIQTLTNGIDPQALAAAPPQLSPREGAFILQYAGLLNDRRNPEWLWEGLEQLCQANPLFHQRLELRLAGQVGKGVLASIGRHPLLAQKLLLQGYVPQQQVAALLAEASLLLLLIDNEAAASLIIPAKLFEYLGARKPILYIGDPLNDAGRILQQEGAGRGYAFSDSEGPTKYVQQIFRQQMEGGIPPLNTPLQPYLRSTQARQLAAWMDALLPEPQAD
ncbi:glycosyltransferase [Cesiribacter andamanensis]|uniref:Glycosyltransferase subfamily 4-like N-terminal domain-containing protein n=1 Tax=Cesiribacter andamanensis AMV16 TaxID=1279009 RepID=M7N7J3_9BACT|nr:glycosyltransferase [Cesiribacter andamanensis]EMR03201.1 hypothetical protein ADICEAN_01679 [Cesiribacter andamanensis AMV16]